MSEVKPRDFLLTVYFEGLVPILRFNKFVQTNTFKQVEQLRVIEYSAYEKLQERVKHLERLEKLEIENATCCMENEKRANQLEIKNKALISCLESVSENWAPIQARFSNIHDWIAENERIKKAIEDNNK